MSLAMLTLTSARKDGPASAQALFDVVRLLRILLLQHSSGCSQHRGHKKNQNKHRVWNEVRSVVCCCRPEVGAAFPSGITLPLEPLTACQFSLTMRALLLWANGSSLPGCMPPLEFGSSR